MFKTLQTQTRIAAFVAASLMALAVNGGVLVGIDHLAKAGDAQQASQAGNLMAQKASSHVAL